MISRSMLISIFISGYIGNVAIVLSAQTDTQTQSQLEPIRKSFMYEGNEREYFIWLPKEFDPAKKYWGLVAVHGGGSNGRNFWLARDIRNEVEARDLEAIVISPSFDKKDPVAQRYPAGVEGQFLEEVLHRIRKDYHLHPRILLTGYSRGAQFSHRFTLWNPEMIEACAPLAPGSWTTPDGRYLSLIFGEIEDPKQLLKSKHNDPDFLEYLQDPRVAERAGRKAEPGTKRIPFLVMCGSLDKRLEIAKKFVENLKQAGYTVETAWPNAPHVPGTKDEYHAEFKKYSRGVVEFFGRVTEDK